MHAYQIKLDFRTDGVTAHAVIKASNPVYPTEEAVMLTPDCMSYRELEVQVESLKGKLDKALKAAKTKFPSHAAAGG